MTSSPIISGEPFSLEKTKQIVEQFYRDGFVIQFHQKSIKNTDYGLK